jgi:hypothetical protein
MATTVLDDADGDCAIIAFGRLGIVCDAGHVLPSSVGEEAEAPYGVRRM